MRIGARVGVRPVTVCVAGSIVEIHCVPILRPLMLEGRRVLAVELVRAPGTRSAVGAVRVVGVGRACCVGHIRRMLVPRERLLALLALPPALEYVQLPALVDAGVDLSV